MDSRLRGNDETWDCAQVSDGRGGGSGVRLIAGDRRP